MKRLLLLTLLISSSMALAQDRDRVRGQARTGTRILDPMEIVFDTAPIRLSGAIHSLSGADAPIDGPADDRPSITFILDHRLKIASEVFRTHPGFATDELITGLDSLEAVREFLVVHDQGPFGLINLVAHGSPQTGLNVRVRGDGPRASSSQMMAHRTESSRPSRNLDERSIIRVYGCGIASDPALLEGLTRFFTIDSKHPPQLQALREFIVFSDQPELSVTLREGLSIVAPGRMAARRMIEKKAASQQVPLPYGWERDLDTKPLEIELPLGKTDFSAREAAGRSPVIAGELDRLSANLADFHWFWDDEMLKGRAVIGYLAIEPSEHAVILDRPKDAAWVASR